MLLKLLPVPILGLIAEYLYTEDYVNMAAACPKKVPYRGDRYDRLSMLCDKTVVVDLPDTYGLTFWVGKSAVYKEFKDCYDYLARAEELPESLIFAQLPNELLYYASDNFLRKYGKNFNPRAAIALRKFLAVDFDETWIIAAEYDDIAYYSHFRDRVTAEHLEKIKKISGPELINFVSKILGSR